MTIPMLPSPPPNSFDAIEAAERLVPEKLEAWRQALRQLKERPKVTTRPKIDYFDDTIAWCEAYRHAFEVGASKRGVTNQDKTYFQLQNAVADRNREIRDALQMSLRQGELVGYLVPKDPRTPFEEIQAKEWQVSTLRSLHPSKINNGRLKGEVVVFSLRCRADEERPKRKTGRPAAPAREPLMEIFRRRRQAVQTSKTAYSEAKQILGELRAHEPSAVLPQPQTVAKWLQPYF